MMSQGQLSIAIPHRRLAFLGSLPVLGEDVKGHRPWRGWALQAAGGSRGA